MATLFEQREWVDKHTLSTGLMVRVNDKIQFKQDDKYMLGILKKIVLVGEEGWGMMESGEWISFYAQIEEGMLKPAQTEAYTPIPKREEQKPKEKKESLQCPPPPSLDLGDFGGFD